MSALHRLFHHRLFHGHQCHYLNVIFQLLKLLRNLFFFSSFHPLSVLYVLSYAYLLRYLLLQLLFVFFFYYVVWVRNLPPPPPPPPPLLLVCCFFHFHFQMFHFLHCAQEKLFVLTFF